MKSEKSIFTQGLILMCFCLIVLLCLQLHQNMDLEQELRLASAVGRLHQHNTQLTASAQLALSTGAPIHQANYRHSFKVQETLLVEALQLAPEEEVRTALQSSFEAHRIMAETEKQAMQLCRQRQCSQGLTLLQSQAYQFQNLQFSGSLDLALDEFQSHLHLQSKQMQSLVIGLQLLILGSAVFLVLLWRRLQISRLHTLQVTMRTVMDVVNNNLNRMQLQQLRWKKQTHLSAQDFAEFRDLLRETSLKLKTIGDLQVVETHGQGPAELLNWQTQTADLS